MDPVSVPSVEPVPVDDLSTVWTFVLPVDVLPVRRHCGLWDLFAAHLADGPFGVGLGVTVHGLGGTDVGTLVALLVTPVAVM